jgi:hypothetical protein
VNLLHEVLTRLFPPAPEPLGELRPGRPVLVRGEVVPRDLLDSPLSHTPCVYYRSSIESWRRTAMAAVAGDGFWEVTDRDEAIAEFYLAEGAVRVIVAPHDAVVELPAGRPIDLGDPGRRGHESVIAPGARVEVAGQAEEARDVHDESTDYRSSAIRIVIRSPRIRLL